MATKTHAKKRHSEEYFGEFRDFWWNKDFLHLMGERWGIEEVRSVLDVGCGMGHWTLVLGSILPERAKITGVDREPDWVKTATERAKARGQSERYRFIEGSAESLPFPDNSFDMVTCQTLLMHVADPKTVLKEMLRVLKPSGLLAVAEPNNVSATLVLSSLDKNMDEVLDRARFHLHCERGKEALGEGNDSLGDLLPGHFAELGLSNIKVYISDKSAPVHTPYETREQKAFIEQQRKWLSGGLHGMDQAQVKKYYLAGGGPEERFEHYWNLIRNSISRMLVGIESGEYHSAGGCLVYLVSGRKRIETY